MRARGGQDTPNGSSDTAVNGGRFQTEALPLGHIASGLGHLSVTFRRDPRRPFEACDELSLKEV